MTKCGLSSYCRHGNPDPEDQALRGILESSQQRENAVDRRYLTPRAEDEIHNGTSHQQNHTHIAGILAGALATQGKHWY